jgi:hypothetical protein
MGLLKGGTKLSINGCTRTNPTVSVLHISGCMDNAADGQTGLQREDARSAEIGPIPSTIVLELGIHV